MPEFGLIGYPLSHSFSQQYFTEKFFRLLLTNYTYLNFEIDGIDKLKELMELHPDLAGFNITIPYKEKVIDYLDVLDETAKNVGAVNTVKISSAGGRKILKGFNTDVYGFEESLKPCLKKHHKAALILGTGGASKAIKYVLEKLNINYKLVSRTQQGENLIYGDLNEAALHQHQIIINTTPLGAFPEVNKAPNFPYQYLNSNHLCFDLIYNPDKTMFLNNSEKQGSTIKNGFEMLQLQADKAWQIWNDNNL